MSPSRHRNPQLAARVATAALFLALAAAVSPFVPSTSAIDPTADPGASPSAEPSAGPTVDPAATPDASATPEPSATSDPTPLPTPEPTPEPAPEPSPTDPAASPGQTPPATPAPTPDPSLYPLVEPTPPPLVPASLIDPTMLSPHTLDSLVSDGCGSCHRANAASDGKLLAASYRTDLKPVGEPYQRTEFALCFSCHEPEPFEAAGTGGTNFDLHAAHVAAMPADGNAVCAECHYQLHAPSAEAGSKLVNFAPNVVTVPLVPPWSGTVTRSCTLTCHGYVHADAAY